MKAKAPVIIGTIFTAYLAFVAIVVMAYDPTPDDMHWEDRQAYNKAKLTEINLGQSLTEITELMGHADFSEAKISQSTHMQVLFYRTHHLHSDGETSRDECTPLLFKDNKLIAWGEETYQQYLNTSIDT